MPEALTPAAFVAKWSPVVLSERAASQEHFIDLCRLLGQPTPAGYDATGADYAFEKGANVTGPASKTSKGDTGFADVWWRGKFAWEYKRKDKHKSLDDAYRQLLQYREALDNPPLLVVCDITRTEIHTNFTNTAKQVHVVKLASLPEPASLDLLRRVFTDPESFKPQVTPDAVTQEVARQIGEIARSLRNRNHDAHAAAHFLMKCMFCLFAEDVGLLPGKLFERILTARRDDPGKLAAQMTELFNRMRTGGTFGADDIAHFNGGLFDEAPAIELTRPEIALLCAAARPDWASVEPAIFGTLFERSLDPNTRAQIGAHYTSRDDIMLVVEPVIMQPLRREWAEVKEKVQDQLDRRRKAKTKDTRSKAEKAIFKLLGDFVGRVATVRVLDPACGSGNFLYVAIQQLLELEKEVITFAAQREIGIGLLPQVRPTQLHGIEINPYAAELAQVVIWIGYLQWMRDNGFVAPRDPILEPIQSIECRDAVLDLSNPALPVRAKWPEADFIIGNPPFLGSKLFRQQGLPDDYIDALYKSFDLPNTVDLCCYFFELARQAIERRPHVRAGLLATQGIRGGSNRTVLERVKNSGDIFMAWSDRKWILDGAHVHVSIVGFSTQNAPPKFLDGTEALCINSDLSAGENVASACILTENTEIAFMGDTKGGSFDIEPEVALRMLKVPNPIPETNAAVLRPWINGSDLTSRRRAMWIIDFGCDASAAQAASFQAPFAYIKEHVAPIRSTNRRKAYAERWWIHVEPRPALRAAVAGLQRFLVTTRVAKHRLFDWFTSPTLPDSATFAFARADDYFFGVLHSSVHELWALRQGTQLEDRPRYTPSTCFETFPLPWPPGSEPTDDPLHVRISTAAKDLDEKRQRWLNPPEWIEPLAAEIDADDDFADVPADARALIRESAIMAAAAKHPQLKKRTLTNLYNQRPTWLALAHAELDRAVLAAYAAVDPEGDWQEDWAEVWQETGAGQVLPPNHPLAERRKEVDERLLANLLRMNLVRAEA